MANKNGKQNKESITKRVILRAARKGVKKASVRAMKTAGYLLKVEGDWVVKVDAKGNQTRVKRINNTSADFVLD